MRVRVDPPPAAAPMYGLIAAARLPGGEDDRWVAGFEFAPEACGGGLVSDPCGSAVRDLFDPNPDLVATQPFLVAAVDRCTTLDNDRDREARARRALEAVQSYQVERELWSGALAAAAGWPNQVLAAGGGDAATDVTPAGGAVPLREGVSLLEQALADCGRGRRGMIHMPVLFASRLGDVVRRDGQRLYTNTDTIVVPGAGYPGTGPGDAAPAAGELWVYATGLVEVRLSPVEVLGADAAGVSRSVNTREVWAQRYAAAAWDGCCHFAIRIQT